MDQLRKDCSIVVTNNGEYFECFEIQFWLIFAENYQIIKPRNHTLEIYNKIDSN
jgi:hypothetical protein